MLNQASTETVAGTVYVVDDDEAARESLKALLTSAGYDVESHASGLDFLAAYEAQTRQPGCLLLDIRMPELDGLGVQRELNSRGASLPTVVVTGHGDIGLAVQSMKEGALDFVEKPYSEETILASVRDALTKSREAAEQEQERLRFIQDMKALTAREQEVLEHLIGGLSNKEIAHRMEISPRTVEIHRARVMTKMGARNIADLIRRSVMGGLAGS